ncbi:MAG: hypothetical protein N2Z76_09025 [Treponemataceae bacterium]|nr:hypothetical protein [Treponemataceae bacterium]
MKKIDISALFTQRALHFLKDPRKRRLVYLGGLLGIALLSIGFSGKGRYLLGGYVPPGKERWEIRFIQKQEKAEENLRRFVEESLLGIQVPESSPIFHPETQLQTVMIRGKKAYIGFSAPAALPISFPLSFEKRATFFCNLVQKNFPFLEEITLFISGNEVYTTKVHEKLRKRIDK